VGAEMAAHIAERQIEALVDEIQRYLEVVDAFRTEGREPRWRAEVSPPPAAADRTRSRARKPRGSTKPREGG
jgi:hypothetical protein